MDTAAFLHALSFAAYKHRDQKRKNVEASPYINHPIGVAEILAREGGVTDVTLLMAAVLHDTVEDTETTHAELVEEFGRKVADIVLEVTDDKSLPSPERKLLQIQHAPSMSPEARQLKIADKTSNVRDVVNRPPTKWTLERRIQYIDWAEQVVAGCRGVNPTLDAVFDAAIADARRSLAASV
jgi:guanosine-3',5'-bis(diphosphate) 3'-pyrophosphohydrolase